MNPPKEDLREIARHFQTDADFLAAVPCSSGHINDTFVGTYRRDGGEVRFIHQWINHHVFKQPERVMENIDRVTSHQRRQLVEAGCADPERRALSIVPALDGPPYSPHRRRQLLADVSLHRERAHLRGDRERGAGRAKSRAPLARSSSSSSV